jgi:hypothetical protein
LLHSFGFNRLLSSKARWLVLSVDIEKSPSSSKTPRHGYVLEPQGDDDHICRSATRQASRPRFLNYLTDPAQLPGDDPAPEHLNESRPVLTITYLAAAFRDQTAKSALRGAANGRQSLLRFGCFVAL